MKSPVPKVENDLRTCKELLGQCEMFEKVSDQHITTIAQLMTYKVLHKNDILLRQGSPSDRFFLLESGDIRRGYKDPQTGKKHNVEFAIKAKSINSMRILSGEPTFSTVKCVSDTCKVYEMQRDKFLHLLQTHPTITTQIAEGLCEQLRIGSKKYATPLLEQQQQEINITSVAIAAGIESYYRSALNAMLNAKLTGVKAEFFPNMHIQVPSRIAYISGFKGLRTYLDTHVDADTYPFPTAVRLAEAITPGVLMTPLSSLLEASNAGHMNPESMSVRWMRGVIPRTGREIVFGFGLNQMSDYFEERMQPLFGQQHAMVVNAAGSLLAGVVSGYFSHVPHNMSTLKLMHPHKSYGELYRMFVDKSVPVWLDRWVRKWPSRNLARSVLATLFPRGVFIRTTQIVGSFIILNGTINYLQLREEHKFQQAMGAT